jgi:cytochrome c oxidase subunit 2
MRKLLMTLLVLLILTGCVQKLVPNTEKSDSNVQESSIEEKQEQLGELTQKIEQSSKIFDRPTIADPEEDNTTPTKKVLITARQFAYEPDLIEVKKGDKVAITITSLDVGHGFALPDFGINTRVPAEESVTVIFVADKKGEFQYFNSVYSGSGWKNMTGKLVVK